MASSAWRRQASPHNLAIFASLKTILHGSASLRVYLLIERNAIATLLAILEITRNDSFQVLVCMSANYAKEILSGSNAVSILNGIIP